MHEQGDILFCLKNMYLFSIINKYHSAQVKSVFFQSSHKLQRQPDTFFFSIFGVIKMLQLTEYIMLAPNLVGKSFI